MGGVEPRRPLNTPMARDHQDFIIALEVILGYALPFITLSVCMCGLST